MLNNRRRNCALLLAASVIGLHGLLAFPALAQQVFKLPWIPPELLDESRSLDDDELTFCLNTHSAMVEFDRAVAQAIADVLLLDAAFHEMVHPTEPYKYDYRLPLNESQLFVSITNYCDAFMGFRITPNSIPEWLTVSRPYLESNTVFASSDATKTSFDALPRDEKIGVRLGATGHRELRAYLQSLPEDGRPSQVPYPTNELLLERLKDGSVGTILIWELAPYYASGGTLRSLGIASLFPPPFPIPPLQFSVAMLKEDTFVRGLIDSAIAELETSGELEQIQVEYLPGEYPS